MAHKVTKSDIQKMEEEIDRRKHIDRPRLLEAVKEARAQGDLSENFEYYAAKKEKNKNEARIRYLDRMIRLSEVIDDSHEEGQAGIGDEVTVVFEEDRFEDTYILVTTMRADSLKNYISIESPIGRAIKGAKVGDKVKVVLDNKSEFFVTIKKICKSDKDVDIASF